MRELTGKTELLYRGGSGPVSRLLALAAAASKRDKKSLLALGMPDWEQEILRLRTELLGPRIEAELPCPNCGAEVALGFDSSDLPREVPEPPAAPMALSPLLAGDIAALEESGETGEAALAHLLAVSGGVTHAEAVTALSGPDREALTAALEVLVSGLGIELATECTECGSAFTAPFDIAQFTDAEMDARASRLLDEVHLIASVYHWSEADILALPVDRRQDYITRILAERPATERVVQVA